MCTVCYLAKILHWKQFTTKRTGRIRLKELFAISQRYYIESNSQRVSFSNGKDSDCLLSRKDTTLKAIHNVMQCLMDISELFAISQRYYIESNSQRSPGLNTNMIDCLLSRKDTTLKAIHNPSIRWMFFCTTVCYLAKILHWKQFTTEELVDLNKRLLFAISQRYYIESNSQRMSYQWNCLVDCLLSRKDTTLKAIHNHTIQEEKEEGTVCYLAKILHWKQFTTRTLLFLLTILLFAISQRYYIESNSQHVVINFVA